MFQYAQRRKNPQLLKLGSRGFPDGWNSLADAGSLKDTELSTAINAVYLQYGTVAKRQGTVLVGNKRSGSTKVINAKMCYNIDGTDYLVRITDTKEVEYYNWSTSSWGLLTGNTPSGYSGDDPEFVNSSPVFKSNFINIVQAKNRIYFAGPDDRVTIFDGTNWEVFDELSDPTTRPTITKTGSETGTHTYYYRYAWVNKFGTTLASPANTGGESVGQGYYNNMPEIDGNTYLTVSLPSAPSGATYTMIFRGEVAGNEFFLAKIPASQTTYVDKDINPDGEKGVDFTFKTPSSNNTIGFYFYLLDVYRDMLVGVTKEFGKDVIVWSGIPPVIEGTMGDFSFALPDGAGFDDYDQGDGQTINAIKSFSITNEDGLLVFKDRKVGILKADPAGGFNVQNINVVRGCLSPFSPHVAGNDIRFYSQDGVATIGHAQNYGTILRYSVISLPAQSVTNTVKLANLNKVCSEYYNGLSFFGISTGDAGTENSSILVYDERYGNWSHWTGLHPSVLFKAINPLTKEEKLYFGASSATSEYGGYVVEMFNGKTDYATSTGSGKRINFLIETKQYNANSPDTFKKFKRCVIVFGELSGARTSVSLTGMSEKGVLTFPNYFVPALQGKSGFGIAMWGTQVIGTMDIDEGENQLPPVRFIKLRQKDLFWIKAVIQNDGLLDSVSVMGVYFYYTESPRRLGSMLRLN